MKTITQSKAGARRWLLYMLVAMVAWGGKVNAQATYQVGTGTSSSSYLPLYSCYGYNYSQVIYLASEINASGLTGPSFITKIRYYSVSPVSNATWNQWDVYMGNTTNATFASTSAWVPVSSMTQVFSGTITQPVAGQWLELTLATPFFWDGSSNIVVGVDENVASYACTATWQATATTGGTRSILYYSDPTNPNPASPPTANYSTTQIANIQFYAAPAPACSGTPTGGTASSNPTAPCFNGTATLSVTGATLATGLTYQWQTFNGTVWNDVAGATSGNYTTPPVSASTQYRRKIRCGTTDSAYSSTVTVAAAVNLPPYSETFESITANNQLPTCMSATNLGSYTYTYTAQNTTYNQLNHTPGGSKFASYRYGCNDFIYTPAIQLTGGQLYQFSYWYIKDNYTGWNTLQAAYGTSPTAAAQTNIIGTISNPSNTTYQQAIYTFTPATTGTYYMSIYCQANSVPWYLTIDDINLVALPPCSGTPTAGTVTPAGPVSGCPGTGYSFTTTGTTTAANLTYQWLQSTNAAPAWAPAVGTGANSLFFNTPNLTDTIRYRMVVTCTNSNLRDSSSIVTVNVPKVPYAAIPYTEDFENWSNRCSTTDVPSASWTNVPFTGDNSWRRNDQGANASWTSPTYTFNPPVSAVGNYSARWHGYYAPTGNTTGGFMDLFVNCSTVTGNKELQFYYKTQTGTPYPNDSVLVYMSTNGGGTFSLLGAYGPNSGNWDLKILPIVSNSATTVIRFRAKDDYQYYGDIGIDYVRILPPCSGHPTAGTVKPVTPCPNADFQLSLLGSSQAAGLSYQWQSSTNGTTWSGAGITNGTQAIATGNIAVPTWFRCIVTCTNSTTNNIDTTAPYQVQLAPFYVCYCQSGSNPAYYNYGNVGNFKVTTQPGNVTLLNNGTASPLTYNAAAILNYTSFTGLTPVDMYQDSLYKFFVTEISQTYFVTGTNYGAVYLDYDRNGSFDPYERIVYQNITNTSTQQISDTFRIPDTASVGLTGMRVIVYPYYSTINPCGTYYYGETEDYLANIKYPPCNGPTNAGIALTSDTAMCPGYSFLLTDTTHEYHRSGIVWNWQVSTNNGGSWTNIAGSTGKDTLSQIFSSTAWYRLKMLCSFSGDSTFSNSVKISIKPPYKCYCYSIAVGGAKNDTSDIGALSIGNFIVNSGGPHLRNPVATKGRTDYTDLGPLELYADTTYEVDVYHTMPNGNHADARVTLFMDFNNNLQYDLPQERVDILPASTTNWTSTVNNWYLVNNITIPGAVISDVPTGMRVILNNNVGPNTQSDDACGAYVSGETEDYVVVFRKGWKTSVGEIENLKDLALFPNPTTGRFSISFTATATVNDLQISVSNITGQQIQQQEYKNVGHSFVKELDLSTAARGVYFVEIKADGEKTVRKIVVR